MPILGKEISIPEKKYTEYHIVEQRTNAPDPNGVITAFALMAPVRVENGKKVLASQDHWIQIFVDDVSQLLVQEPTVAKAFGITLAAWELVAKKQGKI